MARSLPKALIAASLNSPELTAVLATDVSTVRLATKEDFERLFRDKALTKKILEGGVIATGLEQYEPHAENIPEMFDGHHAFTIGKEGPGVSVCSCQFWPSAREFFFCMFLHGDTSAETAFKHLLVLTRYAVEINQEDIPMTLVFGIPPTTSRQKLLALFKRLSFYNEDGALFGQFDILEVPIPGYDKAKL